ncbi:MAG: Spy/CpxP family protein refolding chaperone [Bryobacteraceae bacterium]
MKRLSTMTLAGALLAATAAAQWGRGWRGGATTGNAPTVQQRIERRLDFLATYLNLTEGQKARFKSALEALQAKNQATWQKELEIRTKLQEAVRSGAPAQTIQALADSLGKLHAERIAAQVQTMATLRGLLTQEQRDKLDKLCPRGCGLGRGGLGPGGLGYGRGART